jgi:RecB family exonuclease
MAMQTLAFMAHFDSLEKALRPLSPRLPFYSSRETWQEESATDPRFPVLRGHVCESKFQARTGGQPNA